MKLTREEIESAFAVLITKYNFILNIRNEGTVSVITLKNEHLKISFTEEYQPQGIYNATLFDGKDLWLGLSTLYEFKNHPFNYELGCIKAEDFQNVAEFLVSSYSELLLGNQEIKEDLLHFYNSQS